MSTKSKTGIHAVGLVAFTLALLGAAEISRAQTATLPATDTSEVDAAARPGSVPLRKPEAVAAISENNHLILLPWYNLGQASQGPWVPGYMKLITPIVQNEGNMFSIKIKGYRYGSGASLEIRCGGYAYSGQGLINSDCFTEGTSDPVGIGVENNKVIVTVGSGGGQWYYDHFTAEYSGWTAKDPNDFNWAFVYNAAPATTNTHNVIIKDSAGTISATGNVAAGALTTSGSVGIGTATPNQKLQVVGNVWADGVITSNSEPQYGAGSQLRSWGLNKDDSSMYIEWGNAAGNILYITDHWRYQSPVAIMAGNVGIGTAGPNEKLEILGNLKVSANGSIPGNITAAGTIDAGSIKARYQDVAEWVPSSEQLSAGTVVVLDATKSNQVTSSTVSYDTRVAGVVSEQPGITLGEKGENKVLVATTGRVRVKVDATKSPIHIGDLLVTSDVPGVAMKSEPVNLSGVQFHRPGTLIGKALEPLQRGKGEILVLLSLQ